MPRGNLDRSRALVGAWMYLFSGVCFAIIAAIGYQSRDLNGSAVWTVAGAVLGLNYLALAAGHFRYTAGRTE